MAEDFATPLDLDIYTGRSVNEDQAMMMLAQASALIRSHCGWHIYPAVEEALTLDGSGAYILELPSLQVITVGAVTEDGIALTAGRDYEWSRIGFLTRLGSRWTNALRGVVVELTHGREAVPPEIQAVCLGMAARAVASPSGVKAEQSGGLSVTYTIPGGLMDFEAQVLERYRIPGRP